MFGVTFGIERVGYLFVFTLMQLILNNHIAKYHKVIIIIIIKLNNHIAKVVVIFFTCFQTYY